MKIIFRKTQIALLLAIFLFSLLGTGQNALAQEIPNGDGDLLWERPLNGRTVNDAKFHPINGNIIAAVNHEIWEIDPKDGHTIRVFEGPTKIDKDMYLSELDISPDGNLIVTNGLQSYSGIYFWDYNEGKLIDSLNYFSLVGRFYPDNQTMIFWARPTPGGINGGLVKYNYKSKEVLLEKEIGYEKYLQLATLSKDGKYLPLGLYNKGSEQFSMELWDAETLTKIKDFGSPGDIHQFRDVQISDDNQYVGYTTGGGITCQLFNTFDSKLIQKFNEVHSFIFSPDSKKILISSGLIEELNFLNLSTLDTVYQYKKLGGDFCINKENEIFSVGFDYTIFSKMQFFSNKWFVVGISKPIEINQATIFPNPASDYITLTLPPLEKRGLGGVLQEIQIYDIFGTCALNVRAIHELPLRIDVSTLPAGVYFFRIGNEKPTKFVKI